MCDICKVWMADNKISIEIHERGKKHKEMAQRRIVEARKKGAQEIHDRDEVKRQLEALEKAARKAYEKDREDNPNLPCARGQRPAHPSARATSTASLSGDHLATAQMAVTSSATEAQWAAYTTEEGHVYYHNYSTGESTWEKPAGFLDSLPESSAPGVANESARGKAEAAAATAAITESPKPCQGQDKVKAEGDGGSDSSSPNKSSALNGAENKTDEADDSPEKEEDTENAKAKDEKHNSNRKRPWRNSARDSAFGGWTTVSLSSETASSIQSGVSSQDRATKAETTECAAEETSLFELSDNEDLSEMLKFGERAVPSLEQVDNASSGAGLFKKRKRTGGSMRKRAGD